MDGDLRPSAKTRRLQAFRRRLIRKVPAWYSPWVHLAGTVGIGVVTLFLAAPHLAGPTAYDFVTVPVALVFANLVEWLAHKHLMHHRRRPFTVLFDRHTPEHHRVYVYETMAIEDLRELRLVLIPALGVLGIVLLAVPAAIVAGLLVNENVGWLFLMTSAVYVVGYELSHLAYHLPERSLVYRLPFLRALREHHARHHHPELMQKANFNVTIPLFDLVFGTLASAATIEKVTTRAQGSTRGEPPTA
jgi:sterol desaturase/sphingolipid hydroxylase (fatty acid hydroxylase superfamily)